MKNKCEVADIFRLYGKEYREQNNLPYKKLKVMHKIEVCRTAQLGGHIEQCDECGYERIAYNSCRDRHRPWSKKNGSMTGRQICCRVTIFIWSLPFPMS